MELEAPKGTGTKRDPRDARQIDPPRRGLKFRQLVSLDGVLVARSIRAARSTTRGALERARSGK